MWGRFFKDNEHESIYRYQSSPFNDDFYRYFIKSNYGDKIINEEHYLNIRQKVKDDIMLFLNDDNPNHRYCLEHLKTFRKAFPGVDK